MQFRELLAERERGESLALFHNLSGAHRRPDPHKEMDVIGLYRQFQNRPALLRHISGESDPSQRLPIWFTNAFLRRLGHQMRW